MQVSKAKKGYKLIEIRFKKFEEIPEDWEINSLSEIVKKIKAGGTPKSTEKRFYSGKIPFVTIKDISSSEKFLDKTGKTLSDEGLLNSSSWLIPSNSILLSMYASIGKTVFNKIPVTTHQGILGIIPNEKIINLHYLYYILSSMKYLFESLTNTGTQANLNLHIVKNCKIIFPKNLSEQKNIASILSNVDNTLERTNQLIQKTELLKKGLMQELFVKGIGHTRFKKVDWFFGKQIEIPEEWEIKTCKEISTKILDGEHNSPEYSKEGIPYISSQHVKSKIIFTGCKLVSHKVYEKLSKRCNPEFLDMLITVKGTIGFCKLVDIKTKFCMDRNVGVIKPNQKIDPIFLEKIMSSEIIQKQIYNLTEDSVIPSLYLNKIKEIILPMPSLSEQKQIATILSNVDSQINKEKLQKLNLERLKKGLMQKLLTGQIRVKA